MNVPGISYKIVYDGRNITKDISGYIESISYTDALEGQSDEIQIVVDDSTAVWRNAWYPNKGSKLELTIGSMNCGVFEIDEFISTGGAGQPSLFVIKALALGKNSPVRTEKSYIHEKKTLKEVVLSFCTVNQMFLGDDNVIEDIKFDRLVQERQTDVAFIASLGARYGHIFSMRNNKVTFTEQINYETKSNVAYNLTRADYDRWSFRDKTEGTYSTAEIEYYDPNTGEGIKGLYKSSFFPNFSNPYRKDNTRGQFVDGFFNPDVLRIYDTAENQTQADRLVKAGLYRKNSEFRTGTIGMKGNEKYVAGLIININDIGEFSGRYIILSSRHVINKNSGYTTDLELKHSDFTEIVESNETTE